MRYTVRAPLRVDFGGGWTDVPLYSREQGGAVLNAAITQYVRGAISRPSADGLLGAIRGDRSHLSYTLDLPSGAGLGGSAAQTVAWVTLVKSSIANVSDRLEIADMACRVSEALGIVGGRQDEYASALGGITYLTFGEGVQAERLTLDSGLVALLRSSLVLVYSGSHRLSPAIHASVWGRFSAGSAEVVSALARLRELAERMKDALEGGDLHALGELMNENWACQKALHGSVSNSSIDAIVAFASQHGAIGGKACGAGGGGCLLFMTAPGEAARLEAALRSRRLQVIDFDFDTYGVYLSKG